MTRDTEPGRGSNAARLDRIRVSDGPRRVAIIGVLLASDGIDLSCATKSVWLSLNRLHREPALIEHKPGHQALHLIDAATS